MRNAKQKAAELARFLQCGVGKVLAIQEENTSEWEGTSDLVAEQDLPTSLQQRMTSATVNALSKIVVTFELKTKGRKTTKS